MRHEVRTNVRPETSTVSRLRLPRANLLEGVQDRVVKVGRDTGFIADYGQGPAPFTGGNEVDFPDAVTGQVEAVFKGVRERA